MKNAISMPYTKEGFESIREELIKMSCDISSVTNNINLAIIVNNLNNRKKEIGTYYLHGKQDYSRTYIPTWNGELFLAITAMHDDNIIHYGEWGWHTNVPTNEVELRKYSDNGIGKKAYTKATMQELIDHFAKQEFIVPEKWYIRGCKETADWQKKDMKDGCNCALNSYNLCYATNDPELKTWHTKLIDDYKEITFEQFYNYIYLKKDNMKETEFEITMQDMKKIHDIACTEWKKNIEDLTVKYRENIFSNTIKLPKHEVKRMFDAATSDQKKVLEIIFPTFKTDIPDKALIWFWGDTTKCTRRLGFYDAVNNRPYNYDGSRRGDRWDHYEIATGIDFPWVEEMRKNLKD